MKGAFSSADEVLEREIFNQLFPDTPYGVESGGDPACIPDLTYEQFLDFHRKYYHPSNSYIYLYGNMDMEACLNWMDEKYLSAFDRIEVASRIPMQKPFSEGKDIRLSYPVMDGETLEDNTYLSLNIVTGSALDMRRSLAFTILEYILLDAPGAPVKQALLDAGIGKDVYGSYNDGILQPFFSIVSKNTEESKKEEFLRIIRSTLEKIVTDGIDQKAVEAGINYFEFRFREADYGSFPKGLIYGLDLFDTWLYDEEQPWTALLQLGFYEELKRLAKEGYFEELIRDYLLDNPHSAVVTLYPEQGLATRREKETEEKLRVFKEGLSKEEISRLIRQTEELKAFQEEEDSEEVKKKIPLLKRSDIRKEAAKLYNTERIVNGIPVIQHDLFTNGIAYPTLLFDTERIPDEQIPYLGILKSVLGYVDTEHYSYGELFHTINAKSGGIQCGVQVFEKPEGEKDCRRMFGIRAKHLYPKTGFVFSMIREIITGSKLRDEKRLYEIIASLKARLQESLASAGNSTALMRAASYDSAASQFQDRTAGIAFYRLVEKIEANFETEKEKLMATLEALVKEVFRPENLTVSLTADEEGYRIMEPELQKFKECLFTEPVETGAISYRFEQKNEAFCTPGQVQYAALFGNFKKAGYEYHGALRILKVILSYDYLWNNIRVKGGAYGCGGGFRRNGNAYFASYRDPNLSATFEVYRKCPDYIRAFEADEREMTKYIIGTVSEMDTPLNPSAKGSASLAAWFSGITEEDLQKERDEVLQACAEDIRGLADLVEAAVRQNNLCVVGSEAAIEKERALFGSVERL